MIAGGNVVLGTFYWQDRTDNQKPWTPNGWGTLETLDPFLGPEGSEYRPDSLHVPSKVAHPLTMGVDSLWMDSYHGGVVAKPGTTVLAWWSDACSFCGNDVRTPLIGYRIEANGQRLVGVSVYPAYPRFPGTFRGNFYRLWANALGWATLGGTPAASTSAAAGAPIQRSHVVDLADRGPPVGGSAARPSGR